MGVLAMLELEGDTADLIAAGEELDRLLPRPEGLLLRIVAPTDDGMVLFQLWDSPELRARHAENPAHAEALKVSGMQALVRGSHSRVFDEAELRYLDQQRASSKMKWGSLSRGAARRRTRRAPDSRRPWRGTPP